MIEVKLSDEKIQTMKFAGTPAELAAEIAFTACFLYGQLFAQNKDAAERFREALLAVVTDPVSWRQLIPEIAGQQEEQQPQEEPVVLDFLAEKKKRDENSKNGNTRGSD